MGGADRVTRSGFQSAEVACLNMQICSPMTFAEPTLREYIFGSIYTNMYKYASIYTGYKYKYTYKYMWVKVYPPTFRDISIFQVLDGFRV